MQKTRVAVLRGGPSEEYSVSMQTGAAVLNALNTERYEPVDVVITKSGEWLRGGYTRFPEQILAGVDVVFLALHGAYGEDGTVQRVLERLSIPYTGSRSFPSSIAIHKGLTKDTLKETGIKMAPHLVVSKSSIENVHRISGNIADMYGPEYVIKPVSSGSSVGTMMVKNPALLESALRSAFEHYDKVIVEKRIIGKEATCGVIERYRDQDLYVLPPIEIVPPQSADYFDYENKYNDETKEICPGRFSRNVKAEIESVSKMVHQALGLSQYSRSDFMIGDDGIYFLEVNTLPGLAPMCLFPKAVEAVGGTYESFIEHLINDALNR